MTDPTITLRDVAPLYCITGLKYFCQANDLDFRRLATTGYRVSEVEHIDDVHLRQAIERALAGGHRGQQ